MRRAVIAVFIAASTGWGLTAVAEPPSGTQPTSGYRFSLDGKPLVPETVTVAGRRGQLSAGDLIRVNGLWLTLGEQGEYRFRTATEGVLLEVGDGQTRWVGVRVEPNYGEGPDFIDGMATLTPDEVHGLWGIRAETWTRSCASKAAFLDASRVHLTLGQSATAGHDDLPELPKGLRYLEAMRFVGWKNLQALTGLVYLDVLPERSFDARLISGMRHLRVLRIGHHPLEHPEALASLQALESLDLRFHDDLTSVEFARSLPRLRELVVERTSVRDLSPLAGLQQLERVQANDSRVETLPVGELPALRELSVVAAQVTADRIAAFRRDHPQVRVRHGWNESLHDALLGATRIRVSPGEEFTLGQPVPPSYESVDVSEIAGLLRLFEVDENQDGIICGCLCGASIEFLSGDKPLETTHVVCNNMLRWSGWPSDGILAPANAAALLEWLAARGVTGPRDEEQQAKARLEAFERKSARATSGWSTKLRESFEQDGRVASQNPDYKGRFFPAELSAELPVAADRIRLLLRILGADTGSWSGLDWQEVMADKLLRAYDRGELETAGKAALLGTDRQVRRGAARLWDSWQSPLEHWQGGGDPALRFALLSVLQEAQSPDLRQRAISLLSSWWAELPANERDARLKAGLQDPSAPVREEAMLAAGQLQATWAEELLIHVLAGAPATVVPVPPAPPDEVETVDLRADRIGRGSPISEAEVAGLALGYQRSKQAQPLLEEGGSASGSAMLRVARALYDERCDLLTAEDFRTKDSNQPLQLAAVEAVVRCRGKHALDLALGYHGATHWWEEDHVAGVLKAMLLAVSSPGASVLRTVKTLPELRGWYQAYGAEYLNRIRSN